MGRIGGWWVGGSLKEFRVISERRKTDHHQFEDQVGLIRFLHVSANEKKVEPARECLFTEGNQR